MNILYLGIAGLFIVLTIISSFNIRLWMIYAFRAQRFQIGMVLVLLLAVFPFLFDSYSLFSMATLVMMLGAAIYNFYIVFPFTKFSKIELNRTEKITHPISFISCNVRQENQEYGRLVSLIKKYNPDIFLLVEVDEDWIAGIEELEEDYKFNCLHPMDNTYGMAMYSKYKLIDLEVKFLVQPYIPSIYTKVQVSDKYVINFTGLHPCPPAPWNKEEHKDYEIIKAAGITNIDRRPTVVCGDLNDVAWSPVTGQFKVISGMVDPRVGRGFFSTYNVHVPFFRMPIDHFFVSQHFSLISIKRLEEVGSDHFPIYIKLNIEEQ